MTTICKHLLTVSFTLPLTVAIAQRNPSGPIATTPSSPAKRLEIIVPPRPINVVRPEYPRKDRKLKHGEVRLHATIGTDGAIKDLRVVSGESELIEAALTAVHQWHYQPSKVDGVPVEVQHDFFIDFTDGDGVFLGTDDLSSDLPMEPAEDLMSMLAAGELFRVGAGVLPPKPISAPDPEYSEAARKSKYQGTCVLGTTVGRDGRTTNMWVVRPLGEGLDEKALDVLKRWRFEPATKDGKPVATLLNVEFQFRLY